MTAEPPGSPVAEAVRSLEVRWIFPGRLETAVTGWLERFPAESQSREDTYLVDPQLRGLSVKVRGGAALEVKVYRGSPGILDVAGRARGRMEAWQKWSFPMSLPGQDRGDLPGWRPVRKKRRICRFSPASGPVPGHGTGPGRSPSARWNSPRYSPLARTGGPWDSRRPARRTRSATCCRPPRRACSRRPCPAAWNPARMHPGPIWSGCASGRVTSVTPAPEGGSPLRGHWGHEPRARGNPPAAAGRGRRPRPAPERARHHPAPAAGGATMAAAWAY